MAAIRLNVRLFGRIANKGRSLFGQQRFYSAAAAAATQSVGNDGTSKMNMLQAINNALDIAMENDDSAILFGEDVGFGGVFRCSLNLQVSYTRVACAFATDFL